VAAVENAGAAGRSAPSDATVASDASASPSKRRRPSTSPAADVLVQVPAADNVGAPVSLTSGSGVPEISPTDDDLLST
jgi:hypothetical protein